MKSETRLFGYGVKSLDSINHPSLDDSIILEENIITTDWKHKDLHPVVYKHGCDELNIDSGTSDIVSNGQRSKILSTAVELASFLYIQRINVRIF